MITIKSSIKKSKKQYWVVNTSKNNKVLKPSETFPTKRACFTNIFSDAVTNYPGCELVKIHDETTKPATTANYNVNTKKKA